MLSIILGGLLAVSVGGNFYFINKINGLNREMKVAYVIDGDTFDMVNGARVRLAGIDAPEKGECMATEAARRLEELTKNKVISLEQGIFDEWGRKRALVYANGVLVDEILIKEGLGNIQYPGGRVNETLGKAWRYAKEAKIGIHSEKCKTKTNVENPDCQIKGNFDQVHWTKQYYLPTCPHYKTVLVNLGQGDKFFCDEEEAREAGFSLAEDCK